MKKRLLLAAFAATMALSSTALASTDNSVSSTKTTLSNTVFQGTNAPKLVISPNSGTAKENSVFKLQLNNAEWRYSSSSGEIANGINYTMLGDSLMMVSVDADKFDISQNDIVVPLNVEVIDEDTASVTVDSMDSTITPGTYEFAHTVYPQTEFDVSDFDKETGKFSITASDNYGYIFYARDCFKITLPKGFEFESYEKATGEGKYSGKTAFRIDSKYPGIAYISTTSNAAGGNGKMVIDGIKVKALSSAKEGKVQLSVDTMYGKSNTLKFNLYDYQKDVREEAGNDLKTVSFVAGEKFYTVGTQKISMDASVKIDGNNRVIMPARYLANALGINDTNIQWTKDEKGYKAVITKNDITVETRPDEKFLTVNGIKTDMDTSAVIIEDRIYLPLRAIANALGVSDENISWNSATKTASITRK